MESQKLENSLNLALEYEKDANIYSESLFTGLDRRTDIWELIVKYNGEKSLLEYCNEEGITAEILVGGYAILTVPEQKIDALTGQAFLEYAEQPKRLFFADYEGRIASCVTPFLSAEKRLTGRGVFVGIIDSGIDYKSQDFRNPDGTTRIWQYNDLNGGRIFTKEEIDRAFQEDDEELVTELTYASDASGHGTAVAGIAAGNGSLSDGKYAGMAPEAELLVVKLGRDLPGAFPRTTQLMRAVNWMVLEAQKIGRPIAINISIGNTYGAHDGTSLVEQFLNQAAEVGRNCICVGSGNEGADAGHTAVLFAGEELGVKTAEFTIGRYERELTVQIWKNYEADCRVELVSPVGEIFFLRKNGGSGAIKYETEQEHILVYLGEPSPYSVKQEIYLDMIAKENYLSEGVWILRFFKTDMQMLRADLYLSPSTLRTVGTRFVQPAADRTLTIPSSASKVITVGAYDTAYEAYADFSGRGNAVNEEIFLADYGEYVKPDLAAPGVNIVSNNIFGSYSTFTGTSFAVPFVTGAAALLLEWGIVRGNDPYMYGQKVKAGLRKQAGMLAFDNVRPNEKTGYGALCIKNTLIS